MNGLKIRPCKPNDLIEMQQLFVDTISAVCIRDYNGDQIHVWTESVKNSQRWMDILENQYVMIAESGNKIVGFGSLENVNYIDLMYVHKDHQRQGIADKIYQELEAEAMRLNSALLTSDVSKTAKRFFEKNGFISGSEQTKIIKGVEISNFRMTKELKPAKKQ